MAKKKMLRRLLLGLACICLVLTVIFYLFWQISLADFFASIGFGMMIILLMSLLPELIKKGYIEKI